MSVILPRRRSSRRHREVTSAIDLTAGLVAFWKLEEGSGNRSDEGPNSITLTDNNTVGQDASGKIGNAADFISANAEFLSSTDANLFRGDTDFSWAGWVKFDNAATSRAVLGSWQNASSDREGMLTYEGGATPKRWAWHMRNGGTATEVQLEETLSNGVWYFFFVSQSRSRSRPEPDRIDGTVEARSDVMVAEPKPVPVRRICCSSREGFDRAIVPADSHLVSVAE